MVVITGLVVTFLVCCLLEHDYVGFIIGAVTSYAIDLIFVILIVIDITEDDDNC